MKYYGSYRVPPPAACICGRYWRWRSIPSGCWGLFLKQQIRVRNLSALRQSAAILMCWYAAERRAEQPQVRIRCCGVFQLCRRQFLRRRWAMDYLAIQAYFDDSAMGVLNGAADVSCRQLSAARCGLTVFAMPLACRFSCNYSRLRACAAGAQNLQTLRSPVLRVLGR